MKVARIAVTVLVSATLMVGCSSGPSAPTGTESASPAPIAAASPATAAPDEAGSADHEEVDAPALPTWDEAAQSAVVARAEGFVRAWARPDLDAAIWFKGLQGYCTAAAVEGFIWTDPTLIPATEVTGGGSLIEGSATSATVLVPTDGGEQLVVLIHQDDATPWQVASIAPAAPQEQP